MHHLVEAYLMTSMNESMSIPATNTPAAHFATECGVTSSFRRLEREVPAILEYLPTSVLGCTKYQTIAERTAALTS
jgi:hypothetical protein